MSAISALLIGGMPCLMNTSLTLSVSVQEESSAMPERPWKRGSRLASFSIIFFSSLSSSWCQYISSAARFLSSKILMPPLKARRPAAVGAAARAAGPA
eukprot:CAMPEP_0198542496 /NCGR_PEP_ID=MMETSP1462-20131121/57760_1 /TAXON_ID=1333877 /ORGANISM="Brandtodinium nutriculum, Strain RCC3387" /LENGTH=97 /DNA_ID=CAMNT_0044272725 /DNA_START=103 /DNA_END=392 /DNA_ORIENTATION=+